MMDNIIVSATAALVSLLIIAILQHKKAAAEKKKPEESEVCRTFVKKQGVTKGGTWTDEYGVIFSADRKRLIKAPRGLKDYIIPEGTVFINKKAFIDCNNSLMVVFIPDSVTTIRDYAFSLCTKLEVEIPDSVTFIGANAFEEVKIVYCYGALKNKGPWGAKHFITEKPRKEEISVKPQRGCIYNYAGPYRDYCGEIKDGKPHGHGSIRDRRSSSPYPIQEGLYENGTFVSGRVYNSDGESFPYSAGNFDEHGSGYGTGFDSEGKLYTGRWFFGHTEEEFDELWHEIN